MPSASASSRPATSPSRPRRHDVKWARHRFKGTQERPNELAELCGRTMGRGQGAGDGADRPGDRRGARPGIVLRRGFRRRAVVRTIRGWTGAACPRLRRSGRAADEDLRGAGDQSRRLLPDRARQLWIVRGGRRRGHRRRHLHAQVFCAVGCGPRWRPFPPRRRGDPGGKGRGVPGRAHRDAAAWRRDPHQRLQLPRLGPVGEGRARDPVGSARAGQAGHVDGMAGAAHGPRRRERRHPAGGRTVDRVW